MPWETPAAEATLPGRRSRAQATRAREAEACCPFRSVHGPRPRGHEASPAPDPTTRTSWAQAARARGRSIHRTFTGYAGACIQVWRVT